MIKTKKPLIQLTVWIKPNKKIDTIEGSIRGEPWLERFKKQILENPKRQAEIRSTGLRIALFVNDVTSPLLKGDL